MTPDSMNPQPTAPLHRLTLAAFGLIALLATGCIPGFGEPGGLCEEGARRVADDGCNTCVCEDGGWGCTERACEPPPECACAEIYAPVCGVDGETYGNACEAECAEVAVAAEGTCDGACPDVEDPNVSYISADPAECARVDFACGGDARAFSDDCGCGCIANDPTACEGDEVMHENTCKPLCGIAEDGGDTCPEGTACGGCVPDPGCPECAVCLMVCEPVPEPEPCVCPAVYAPVCGLDGETYGNDCEAACAGALVAYEGECPPPCGDPEDGEDGEDGAPQGDGPGDTPDDCG